MVNPSHRDRSSCELFPWDFGAEKQSSQIMGRDDYGLHGPFDGGIGLPQIK
jgi:hypothetical protein